MDQGDVWAQSTCGPGRLLAFASMYVGPALYLRVLHTCVLVNKSSVSTLCTMFILVPKCLLVTFLQLDLDSLLPRAADLAQHSADRRTRVAACEYLYSAALWIIGYQANRPSGESDNNVYARILQRLFPIMLRLASGPEAVARDLFSLLLQQCVRWYTRWVPPCLTM